MPSKTYTLSQGSLPCGHGTYQPAFLENIYPARAFPDLAVYIRIEIMLLGSRRPPGEWIPLKLVEKI
jgi:hypothetical protein